MALGDPYITAAQAKAWMGIDDTDDDTLITSAIAAATEGINRFCQRQFNKASSASARIYVADSPGRLYVDDFYTTTGLVIATDTADSGTYGTTWAATDYVLKPFDGIESGMTGFPYRKILAVESRTFPCRTGRPRVQVTAAWGWNAIPESVTMAARVLTAYLFNLKGSPLGVATFIDAAVIRIRELPQVADMLRPYQRPDETGVLVA